MLVRSRDREDRVLVHRVGGVAPAVVLEGAVPASFAQPLPGGRVLLVAARGEPGTDNAQVWDSAGQLVASAFVGDAIAQVLATPAGSIWIGYFDEARDEIGMRQLVRFDGTLRPEWWYPFPSERADLPNVFDVMALNVHEETALCYAYKGFHLVRVQSDSVTDLGPTGVRGASAVVVDGARGAFVGGWGVEYDLVTPFALRPGGGVDVGAPVGRLVLPDGRDCARLRLTSRGAEMAAVDGGGNRYRVSLDELLDGPRF
ncbi:hypothetical protein CTE05_25460 [Cellulomonas terrae]|uniref:Uncharacterized protein n=1 Tax=Cellulomonas terrae TaxID=311234 RepID=A0A511JM56_9CELL|nr:hypothetical protein CTE05_25460 [Cellulomonas terrae]